MTVLQNDPLSCKQRKKKRIIYLYMWYLREEEERAFYVLLRVPFSAALYTAASAVGPWPWPRESSVRAEGLSEASAGAKFRMAESGSEPGERIKMRGRKRSESSKEAYIEVTQ